MEYVSLIAEFGARYGMEGLRPDEDGVAGFEVSGRRLFLQQMPGTSCVIVTAELGEVPPGAAAMDRLLLRANQALFVFDGMSICRRSEADQYILVARIDIERLDFQGFDEKMAQVLKRVEQWRELLERFAPLADEAAKIPDDLLFGTPSEDLLRI